MGNVNGSLEDRLFDSVVTQLGQNDQHHAQAITGMLLELGTNKVETLLDSEDLLNVAVEKSLKSYLTTSSFGITNNRSSGSERSMTGEVLYEKVEKICPNYSAKITGMLLELDNEKLQTLLDSETILISAVKRAEQVCAGSQEGDIINTGNLSRDSEAGNQTLGDQLYEKVEMVYPDHAAKITGMLLEQPEGNIQKLLQNEDLLLQCIHKSYTALQTAAS